jgi:multisubunit Na+/H+ antiporter MnhB subunit
VGQVLGGLVFVLTVIYFVFLFYSDAKLKRLTGHLDLRWYQHTKRVAWLRTNLDQFSGVDHEDALKALRARGFALACLVGLVVVVIVSSMIKP